MPHAQKSFYVLLASRISCEDGTHTLAQNFPTEEFWEYCCDCQRFWPSDLKHGGQSKPQCVVCERQIVRRYLCAQCKALSVESADGAVKRKRQTITETGAVTPACPGCQRAAEATLNRHECPEAGATFATARTTCPFCEEPLTQAAARTTVAAAFPVAAASYLAQAREQQVRVRHDERKNLLVKDAHDKGALALVHEWSVPGGALYLVPRLARLQTKEDFYKQYELYYTCYQPAPGQLWIVKPAVVDRVAGGWRLREQGVLEVRGDGTAAATQTQTAAPPVALVCAKCGAPAQSNQKFCGKCGGTLVAQGAQTISKHAPGAGAGAVVPPAAAPRTPAAPQSTSRVATQPTTTQPTTQPKTTQPRAGASSQPATRPVVAPVQTTQPTVAVRPEPRAKSNRTRLLVALGICLFWLVVLVVARWSSSEPTSNSNVVNVHANNGRAVNANANNGGSAEKQAAALPSGMVYVPGSEFDMGGGDDPLEQPAHRVQVQPFFIDTYEVTCEDYARFVRETGHSAPKTWTNGTYPSGQARWPVTSVDWDDASAYAAWAHKRLPSEAEWEFAARGPDGRRYPWGNAWRPEAANAASTSHQRMAEVGDHATGPSPYGAYDMVGNAWEWTASELAAYPGGQLPDKLPGNLPVIFGRVIRGGSWASDIPP